MATACKSRSKCDLRHRLGGCLFREQPSPGLAGTAKPLSNQQLGFVNQGTAGKTVPAAVLGCDRLSSGVHRSLRGPPGRGDVLAQPWVPSFQTTREGGECNPVLGSRLTGAQSWRRMSRDRQGCSALVSRAAVGENSGSDLDCCVRRLENFRAGKYEDDAGVRPMGGDLDASECPGLVPTGGLDERLRQCLVGRRLLGTGSS